MSNYSTSFPEEIRNSPAYSSYEFLKYMFYDTAEIIVVIVLISTDCSCIIHSKIA